MARRVSKKKRKTAKKRAAKAPSLLAFIKAQGPTTLRTWLAAGPAGVVRIRMRG